MMVFEGEAFRKRLGHEDRALINEISALMTETPERLLASSTIAGHGERRRGDGCL